MHRHASLDELRAWAELSGDFNLLHIDPEYAATTRFGVPIVHGHLILAWLTAWAVSERGSEWLGRGELRDVRFRGPLLAGKSYVVRGVPQSDGTTLLTVAGEGEEPLVSAVVASSTTPYRATEPVT